MASPVLHVKDAYYFDVPKTFWGVNKKSAAEFPDWWIRLDEDFQTYQAEILYGDLKEIASKYKLELPAKEELIGAYKHWQHEDPHHHGQSFSYYLHHSADHLEQDYEAWRKSEEGDSSTKFVDYLKKHSHDEHDSHGEDDSHHQGSHGDHSQVWFAKAWQNKEFREEWESLVEQSSSSAVIQKYVNDENHAWGEEKLEGYNRNLSGKVIIPQPFGELTNLYEGKGFLISKFMVIELVVALLVAGLFIALAKAVQGGQVARGRFRNLLEVFLTFMRDQVARPAIGHDADKYVPFLWTVFLFVLFLNLAGMVPWVGSPTASFAVTTSLAAGTFICVVIAGMTTFGVVGFFKNLVPSMGLPLPLAIFLVPAIFVIEVMSFLIKHAVLSVRLLANMVAGHLVLAGILGVAFTYEAAVQHTDVTWSIAGVIAVVGSVLFSMLELFVAFLQAYVFAFLSALFIGSVVHEH
jgi:F-type H+-transporting ATPase subunit a